MIVKIGGSVADKLEEIFEVLQKLENVKVVPGGWIFADKVRELNLSDEISHWMAVLSMNLYGYYMKEFATKFELLEPESFCFPNGRHIILPYRLLRNFDELPHSWDVTSDSIALWIARKLGEKRILKVSAARIYKKAFRVKASEAGDAIDAYSKKMIEDYDMEILLCSAEELKNYILLGKADGTLIGR